MNTNTQDTNAQREPDSPDSQEKESTESVSAETRIEELEKQLQHEKNRTMYLYADFENAKKRAIKERADLMKFGWENVARDLLQVIDNLERALAHVPEGTQSNLSEGLHMILNQFLSTLERQGVERIKCLDQPFDPNLHEAVGQEPSSKPEGTVTQEQLPGYTLHGRLLRAAQVIVSRGEKS